jgi:hypothetical protein
VLSRLNHAGKAHLPSTSYEQHLINVMGAFRREMLHLGIAPEMTVMLSILGADQVQLGVGGDRDFLDDHQTLFDRRSVVLPDVLAPGDAAPEQALRPVFDLVWGAAGFAGSRNYNAAGQWAPSGG